MRILLAFLLLACPAFAADYVNSYWDGTSGHESAAEIGGYNDNIQVVLTNAETYYQVTGLAVDFGYSTGGTFITTGSNAIEIEANGAGLYKGVLSASFAASGAGEYHCEVHKESVDTERLAFRRKIANANDYGSATGSGLLPGLVNEDTLTIWCKSDTDTRTLTFDHLSLNVIRIGGP